MDRPQTSPSEDPIPRLTTRTFLKAGLAALASFASSVSLRAQGRGGGGGGNADAPGRLKKIPPIVSPTPRRWVDPMPIMPEAQPTPLAGAWRDALASPTVPNTTEGYCANTLANRPHQQVDTLVPQKVYELDVTAPIHQFGSYIDANGAVQPLQAQIFGYGGRLPGPTFKARYGEPIMVRFRNKLPSKAQHVGFGTPEFTIHLHNLHSPSESDGFPLDYAISENEPDIGPGHPQSVVDNHYVLYPAGNDNREILNTMWYHDHRLDFTAPNVYRGLFGFFLAFDALDNDNEADPNGLQLPSGAFDIPMVFTDPQFDSTSTPPGAYYFNQLDTDGHLGDTFAVNGKLYPVLEVKRRRYRFRFLDGGPSRFYQIFMRDTRGAGADVPFTVIANDGNLLPNAVQMPSLFMGVATRFDVVVDFAGIPDGTEFFLENRLEQLSGRGPDGVILPAGTPSTQLLKIVVNGDPAEADPSLPVPVGRALRPNIPITAADIAAVPAERRRTFAFNRGNGSWTINSEVAGDMLTPRFSTLGNGPEIWTLDNQSGSWSHPIHIHFEEGVIISRNGAPPPAHERDARKDVYVLSPGEVVQVYFHGFRDFKGRFPMHCHNLVHEDHAMMLRFDVL